MEGSCTGEHGVTLGTIAPSCLCPDPQDTDPCMDHTPLLPWQTNGPPLSPWQPLFLLFGPRPAHTILSVIGIPEFSVLSAVHSSCLTTIILDCFRRCVGGPDSPMVYCPHPVM